MTDNVSSSKRPASELIQERQLTPGLATRLLIPALENVLAGLGVVMLVAVVLANWSRLDAVSWAPLAARLATMLMGVLFVVRFGSDELRFLVDLVFDAYWRNRNRQLEAERDRLSWENSQARAAIAVMRDRLSGGNYVPSMAPVDLPDPVHDALLVLHAYRKRQVTGISRRKVVEQAKLLNRERFDGATLVLKQAGVRIDNRGQYVGMWRDGRNTGGTIDDAIAAVSNLKEGE